MIYPIAMSSFFIAKKEAKMLPHKNSLRSDSLWGGSPRSLSRELGGDLHRAASTYKLQAFEYFLQDLRKILIMNN